MSSKVPHHLAFTVKYTGRTNSIVTHIGVSLPKTPSIPPQLVNQTNALWDTGATGSVITKTIAKELGLSPIDEVRVMHAGGSSMQNVYLVDIYLPNKLIIGPVRVTECEDNQGHFGMIVGMDIICMGDFSISNLNGNTVVSFRLPSVGETDFVHDYELLAKRNQIIKGTPVTNNKQQDRNSLCNCGSGKKYKHCHGK